MPNPPITVSIVSHRQNALANQLLADLARICGDQIAIIVTENVADDIPLVPDGLSCQLEHIVNPQPRGFGANHNAAFERSRTPFYCVANPDVRLPSNPFPALLHALALPDVGVVGPLVRRPDGGVEDSARHWPTVSSLLRKFCAGTQSPEYPVDHGPVQVDWVAGMFMLFRTESFRAISGFDEAYFLYYEDVDLCRRLLRRGERVVYVPEAEVIHDARRASRRDLRLMRHHLSGLIRFLRG